MAENKKSFLLYADQIHIFEGLDDDEAGRLAKHLFRYVNDLNPEPPDKLTKVAFEPIKQQLKRDLQKWDGEKEKKSESGILGNLKRWNNDLHIKVLAKEITIEEAQSIAKHRRATQCIANVAVNDNVNVNVNVIPNKEAATGVVVEMVKIFKSKNPSYPIDPDSHYPQCLQIAYRIAKLKGWENKEVLNGKMKETLKSWELIVDFVLADDWLSTRGLIDLNSNKEWDRLIQKMSKAVKEKKLTEKKENLGTPIKKEKDTDFEKYKRKL